MSPTPPSGTGNAERLGLKPGMIVMESGYDDDVDQDLRDSIMELIGADLLEDGLGILEDAFASLA